MAGPHLPVASTLSAGLTIAPPADMMVSVGLPYIAPIDADNPE